MGETMPTSPLHFHDGDEDHDADDHADHCACGIELREDELTSDEDLPPAFGAMAAPKDEADDEEAVDGCDADFSAAELTTDEELPITAGGM